MQNLKTLCKKALPFAALVVIFAVLLFVQQFLPRMPSNMYSGVLANHKPPNMEVHCIDVGQGDSTLINLPYFNQKMLIDTGRPQYGQTVVDYIKAHSKKNDTIDFLVLTHPDNDHIGGALAVIDNFKIKGCYLPYAVHTTDAYMNLLKRLQQKKIPVHYIGYDTEADKPHTMINQSDFKVEVLAPISDTYAELNNYSAVLKLTYYDTSMLFTGDAEELVENEMLSKGFVDLKADLLHVGHHGSKSSTSAAFLQAVSPRYGIISDGQEYGHPTPETLARLQENNVAIYRTDLSGTIVATSDGKEITIETSYAPQQANAPPLATATNTPEQFSTVTPAPQPPTATPTTATKQTPATSPPKSLDEVTVWYADHPSVYHTQPSCSFLNKTRAKGHENTMTLGKAKRVGKVFNMPRTITKLKRGFTCIMLIV